MVHFPTLPDAEMPLSVVSGPLKRNTSLTTLHLGYKGRADVFNGIGAKGIQALVDALSSSNFTLCGLMVCRELTPSSIETD